MSVSDALTSARIVLEYDTPASMTAAHSNPIVKVVEKLMLRLKESETNIAHIQAENANLKKDLTTMTANYEKVVLANARLRNLLYHKNNSISELKALNDPQRSNGKTGFAAAQSQQPPTPHRMFDPALGGIVHSSHQSNVINVEMCDQTRSMLSNIVPSSHASFCLHEGHTNIDAVPARFRISKRERELELRNALAMPQYQKLGPSGGDSIGRLQSAVNEDVDLTHLN